MCVAMCVQVWSPRTQHQQDVTLHAEGICAPAGSIQSCNSNHCWENPNLSFTDEKLTKQGIGLVEGGKESYKHNSTIVLQLSNSTTKCFIHLPLLFGGKRSSPEAPAIILLVAFQWQYSQLPEALINKMKIHTAKLEHTTINNIFLFAGQVNSLCKELLC